MNGKWVSDQLFECFNCGTNAIFKNVYKSSEAILVRCPVCGTEEQEYIYFDKLLTKNEAIEKVRQGESDDVELVDMNSGWHGSRTYKVRGYNEELTT